MDDLVYSAVAVANEFLRRARESYRTLSPTQLHELVYCAQGWHLVVAGAPLISGPVAAHRGGVYVPDLRIAGCWGAQAVAGLLHEEGNASTFPRVEDGTPARFTIDHVWEDYGPLSRYDLTRLTLAPTGPWDQVWNVDERHDSVLIPNRLLREWFGQVATWRTAADRVSSAVDRFMDQRTELRGPIVVDGTVSASRAYNEAMKADSEHVYDLRHPDAQAR
jgi:uncharacterized phage-associated protein